jgi:membrane protein implicated in regulation of membrane protease activity
MTWSDFYLFCFAFGFIFSMVSVLIGHLHLDFGHGHSADFGHGHAGDFADSGHADTHTHHGHGADDRGGGVSPFNLATGAAFLAWFGGTGYLITRFYAMWFMTTLAMAAAAGTAGGWVVYLFLSRVLIRSREHLDPADYDMVGVLGTVSGPIRAGGTGEILFSQQGVRRSAPARSEDGSAVAGGAEVVVTRYESGIAYVRRWEDLTGSDV